MCYLWFNLFISKLLIFSILWKSNVWDAFGFFFSQSQVDRLKTQIFTMGCTQRRYFSYLIFFFRIFVMFVSIEILIWNVLFVQCACIDRKFCEWFKVLLFLLLIDLHYIDLESIAIQWWHFSLMSLHVNNQSYKLRSSDRRLVDKYFIAIFPHRSPLLWLQMANYWDMVIDLACATTHLFDVIFSYSYQMLAFFSFSVILTVRY